MLSQYVQLEINGRVIAGHDDDRPGGMPIRAFRVIMKHVMQTIAYKWFNDFLPSHFERTAYFRYPGTYKKRTASYFARHFKEPGLTAAEVIAKQRRIHEPMVKTGTLRAATQHAVIRAFPTRASIKIAKPHYLRKRPVPHQPDMVAEIKVVNSQERRVLDRLGNETLTANINHYNRTRQVPTLI